jgi:hypothetical protein
VLGGESLSGATGKVVSAGPLPAVLGGEVPVTFAFYERDPSAVCPQGISLVADVADAGRVIYNELSWALEIHQRAGFPFLAIPLKSTGGQVDSGTAVRVGTDQALGFDSGSGAPQWVSPSAESSRELRDHCAYLFQWSMRTAGLELAADASAQVQSGEALRVRSRDFESRALRFARNLQRWEVRTLRLLGAMAGLGPEEIASLEVTYPKRITLPDPAEDLARALTILTAPVEIGAEARSLAVGQAINAALPLTDEQLSSIVEGLRATYGADIDTFAAKQTVERLRASREAEGFDAVSSAPAPADVAPVAVEEPAPAPATVETVADAALDGAQVGSLLEIIAAVSEGRLPVETARSVIMAAFPAFDESTIARMLAPLAGRAPVPAPSAQEATNG